MLTHQEAFWLQFAIVLSPVIAVIITIWFQKRQSKKGAKMRLFMELISTRDQLPIDYNYVLALNRIDVVFHEQKNILKLWHEYYDLLSMPVSDNITQQAAHKRIEMFSAMANHLGYGSLQQIELQKYYQPKGHYNYYLQTAEIQQELLRVLKNTETLYFLAKTENPQEVTVNSEGIIEKQIDLQKP
jgi:hypothetical protein